MITARETGDDMKTLKTIIKQIENHKAVIADRRDKLRAILSELEDIAESCDAGIDALEEAQDLLDRALDDFSQYL